MSEGEKKQDGENPEKIRPDTIASILQATFKHYFEMAMDHHTKAATTSNFLLIIVGAIISFVSLDARIGGTVDFVSGLAVFVIGLFGAAWARKQHERYYYWQHIAYEYQKELVKIVPGLRMGKDYDDSAKNAAAKEYGSLIATKIHERWLWFSLHLFVAVLGLGLMALAA